MKNAHSLELQKSSLSHLIFSDFYLKLCDFLTSGVNFHDSDLPIKVSAVDSDPT